MKTDTNNDWTDNDWDEVLKFFNSRPGYRRVVDYEETEPGIFCPRPGPVAAGRPGPVAAGRPGPVAAGRPGPVAAPVPHQEEGEGNEYWLQLIILMACLAAYAAGVLTVLIAAEVLR